MANFTEKRYLKGSQMFCFQESIWLKQNKISILDNHSRGKKKDHDDGTTIIDKEIDF